jgi:hypothetical protein
MLEPLLLVETGQSYEGANIRRWLDTHSTCPLTSKKLSCKMLAPNHALRSIIHQWADEHGVQLPAAPKHAPLLEPTSTSCGVQAAEPAEQPLAAAAADTAGKEGSSSSKPAERSKDSAVEQPVAATEVQEATVSSDGSSYAECFKHSAVPDVTPSAPLLPDAYSSGTKSMPSPSLLLMPTSTGEVHAAEAAEQLLADAEAAKTVSSSSSKRADCFKGSAVDQSLAAAAAAADSAALKAATCSSGGSSYAEVFEDPALPDAMPSKLLLPDACKERPHAAAEEQHVINMSEAAYTAQKQLITRGLPYLPQGKISPAAAEAAKQHHRKYDYSCYCTRTSWAAALITLVVLAATAALATSLSSRPSGHAPGNTVLQARLISYSVKQCPERNYSTKPAIFACPKQRSIALLLMCCARWSRCSIGLSARWWPSTQ